MRISTTTPQISTPSSKPANAPEAAAQPAPQGDMVEVGGDTIPAKPAKPNWTPAAKAEPGLASKIFGGKAAVIAGGLAVGAAAAAAGMAGGPLGAIAGGIGGAALGLGAVVGVGAVAFYGLLKESPIVALGLIIAGGVVATALSPILIGGAIAGTVAIGALGAAGGPLAAAVAGLGGGLVGAAVVDSAQKSFR